MKVAYQAVTLTIPTDEMLSILSVVGIKRTLEILLIMQQTPSKVKNPSEFIKKAIRESLGPISPPIEDIRQTSTKMLKTPFINNN